MASIGIDLGTTNSLISIFTDSGPELLPNSLGEYLTPSVVGLADDGKTILVGRAAKQRLVRFPDQTRALFKRQMGSGKELSLGRKTFSPTELSSLVLASLKRDAEEALGEPVTEAVISVPAYFNAVQRQATKDAAALAGLSVSRLINEPTAAALANGVLDRDGESTFVILDLGGGTFDVSILEMFDGVMEVRASSGDAFLGGEDFTIAVARHFADKMKFDWKEITPDIRERLIDVSERLKLSLEVRSESKVKTELDGKEQEFSLTSDEFDEITKPLLTRLQRPVEKCLYDAGITAEQVDRVILVGGATRMAAVRSLAAKIFRKLPERSIDPDHAIALGAAVQAGLVDRHDGLKDVVMTDVAPFSMGIEANDVSHSYVIRGAFFPIIERNTILPASRSQYFSTSSDNQDFIGVRIYQGEGAIARDNVLIGNFEVPVPRGPEGQEAIEVRFTYDVSGLLAVDVRILSNDKKVSKVIDNLAEAMSDAEKDKRLKAMEKLKVNPREDAPNVAMLETIKHFYEMMLGDDRSYMMEILARFEAAIATQDPRYIASERKEIQAILDQIEKNYVR